MSIESTPSAGRSRDPPAVGREDAGDQVQQRRLAAAAGADQRDLLAVVEAEVRDVETGTTEPSGPT